MAGQIPLSRPPSIPQLSVCERHQLCSSEFFAELMLLDDRETLSNKKNARPDGGNSRFMPRKRVHCVTLFKDAAAKLNRSSQDVRRLTKKQASCFLAVFFFLAIGNKKEM